MIADTGNLLDRRCKFGHFNSRVRYPSPYLLNQLSLRAYCLGYLLLNSSYPFVSKVIPIHTELQRNLGVEREVTSFCLITGDVTESTALAVEVRMDEVTRLWVMVVVSCVFLEPASFWQLA